MITTYPLVLTFLIFSPNPNEENTHNLQYNVYIENKKIPPNPIYYFS